MTWGYWGIVVGLSVLVMLFFLSMEIQYRRPRPRAAPGPEHSSAEERAAGRHAA